MEQNAHGNARELLLRMCSHFKKPSNSRLNADLQQSAEGEANAKLKSKFDIVDAAQRKIQIVARKLEALIRGHI